MLLQQGHHRDQQCIFVQTRPVSLSGRQQQADDLLIEVSTLLNFTVPFCKVTGLYGLISRSLVLDASANLRLFASSTSFPVCSVGEDQHCQAIRDASLQTCMRA